jgi:predicted nucleic acid-binding protein
MLVVDASVATKWFVVEDLHDEARSLLELDELLLAPRIIEIEVASAIMARARRSEIPQAHALKLVGHWLADFVDSTALHLVEDRKLLEKAARLSAQLDHKLPDCLYLALAQEGGAPLVTADIQQAKKGAGVMGIEVRLLGKT